MRIAKKGQETRRLKRELKKMELKIRRKNNVVVTDSKEGQLSRFEQRMKQKEEESISNEDFDKYVKFQEENIEQLEKNVEFLQRKNELLEQKDKLNDSIEGKLSKQHKKLRNSRSRSVPLTGLQRPPNQSIPFSSVDHPSRKPLSIITDPMKQNNEQNQNYPVESNLILPSTLIEEHSVKVLAYRGEKCLVMAGDRLHMVVFHGIKEIPEDMVDDLESKMKLKIHPNTPNVWNAPPLVVSPDNNPLNGIPGIFVPLIALQSQSTEQLKDNGEPEAVESVEEGSGESMKGVEDDTEKVAELVDVVELVKLDMGLGEVEEEEVKEVEEGSGEVTELVEV